MKSISPSTESEEGEERAAGFVLFRQTSSGRRFLLLRHQGAAEYWAFPKGRLEDGERDFQAAIREVREETRISQIQPIPGFRRESHYHLQRDGRTVSKTVVYYLGETAQEDVALSHEHADYQWLSYDDALTALTYEESRSILRDAERQLARMPRSRES
jgi:8-oxo-dGTP pyrophosphatase MutT (NUDIX family)